MSLERLKGKYLGIKNDEISKVAGLTPNKVNQAYRYMYDNFSSNALTIARSGAATTGTGQAPNVMDTCLGRYEYAAIGTQTIVTPLMDSSGYLDIGMDQTNNDGVDIVLGTNNILGSMAFTVGTDSFFIKLRFSIEDVSGTDNCSIGFRKVQAFNATFGSYTDYASIGCRSGDIKIATNLNNAGETATDTTNDWADTETHTLEVRVSAAGGATYLIDGANPTVIAAFTGDATDVYVPFIYMINDSDVVGKVLLKELHCGLAEANVR